MVIGALCTATAQKLRAKVGICMQNPPQPAEDLVNTRGYTLLLARVAETTKGRQPGESAEAFISRAMLANAPIICSAVRWKSEAARHVKTHAERGKNEEVRFIVASGSSSPHPILAVPKETPLKTTTPFDRNTWGCIEGMKEASAAELRFAVEQPETEVTGVTRVSLEED